MLVEAVLGSRSDVVQLVIFFGCAYCFDAQGISPAKNLLMISPIDFALQQKFIFNLGKCQ